MFWHLAWRSARGLSLWVGLFFFLCTALFPKSCDAQGQPLDPNNVPPGLSVWLGKDNCGTAEWVPAFHTGLSEAVARANQQDFAGALSRIAGVTAGLVTSHSKALECATIVGAALYIGGQCADQLGHRALSARLRQVSSLFTAYDYQMKGEEFLDQSPWPFRWMDAMDGILRSMSQLKYVEQSVEPWRGLSTRAALMQRLTAAQLAEPTGQSVAIVSVCDYDGGQTPLARLSQINKEEYARRFNYDVIIYDKAPIFQDTLTALMTDPPSYRPAAWSKVDAILTTLQSARHDWVLWMDCDSFFMDTDVPLDKIVSMAMAESDCSTVGTGLDDLIELRRLVGKWLEGPPGTIDASSLQQWFDDLFAEHWSRLGYGCGEHNVGPQAPVNQTLGWTDWLYRERRPHLIASEDGLMLNTGVMLIRSSSWSWQFFQKVRAMTFGHSAMTQHPWWEQTAMVYLLQVPFTLALAAHQQPLEISGQNRGYAPACFMMPQKQLNGYPPLVASALKTHAAYESGDFVVSFSGCKVYSSQEVCNHLFLSHFAQAHGVELLEKDPALRLWL